MVEDKKKRQQQKTPAFEKLQWKTHASFNNKVIRLVKKAVSSGKEKELRVLGDDVYTDCIRIPLGNMYI